MSTGGDLNMLNGQMGISAPYQSVAVMKLIKQHSPKSKHELVELIKYHYEHTCSCGIVSKGTVEDFGKNLYNAQKIYWREYRFSLEECLQWEYDLFITNSLKGGMMERLAVTELSNGLSGYIVKETIGFADEEFRIDILIKKDDVEIAGIQVKPSTYKNMRAEVIETNKTANKKWSKPVYYLYYLSDGSFENINEIVNKIRSNHGTFNTTNNSFHFGDD